MGGVELRGVAIGRIGLRYAADPQAAGNEVDPGGIGSVRAASTAASRPPFLTDIVYVSRSPAWAAVVGATVLVVSIRGA